MIKRALIVDTETGTEALNGVIEVGSILYSVEHQTSLVAFSTLVPANVNQFEHVNRIKLPALGDMATIRSYTREVDMFTWLVECADVIVAHNTQFDHPRLDGFWHSKPWVCTQDDFRWPRQTKERESLISLALAHGIGVSEVHRAINDCLLISALFDRVDDLQSLFEYAMRPKATFAAVVSYDDRELAKKAGFRWNEPGFERQWVRRMAIEDVAKLPFRVRQIEERMAVPA
jgi:DNA polymerase-3 subunit epsilon